jgi:hypothetical protein
MPVPAVPTGDLMDIIMDMIKSQKEQPWYILPEARVPTVAAKEAALTLELCNQHNKISKKLRAMNWPMMKRSHFLRLAQTYSVGIMFPMMKKEMASNCKG